MGVQDGGAAGTGSGWVGGAHTHGLVFVHCSSKFQLAELRHHGEPASRALGLSLL